MFKRIGEPLILRFMSQTLDVAVAGGVESADELVGPINKSFRVAHRALYSPALCLYLLFRESWAYQTLHTGCASFVVPGCCVLSLVLEGRGV